MLQTAQLTFEKNHSLKQYEKSIDFIAKNNFKQALCIFDELLRKNVSSPLLFDLMKYMHFWINREKEINKKSNGKEKSQYLQKEWNTFEKFIKDKKIGINNIFFTLKKTIHKKIKEELIIEIQNSHYTNIDSLINLAKMMKEAKEEKEALETLKYALKLSDNNPSVFLLLGECYQILKQKEKSSCYYKEFFFWSAEEEIDLKEITDLKFIKLIFQLREMGFNDKEVACWLPTYARIENFLKINIALSKKQLEKAIQKIKEREHTYQVNPTKKNFLEAVLINSYLYIIEHYSITEGFICENVSILIKKIQNLNPTISKKLNFI